MFDQETVFNALVTEAIIPVDIVDDDLFELIEFFEGVLTATSLPSNVRLAPSLARGAILEDAGIIV